MAWTERCPSFIEDEPWLVWGVMGRARSCLPFSICEGGGSSAGPTSAPSGINEKHLGANLVMLLPLSLPRSSFELR